MVCSAMPAFSDDRSQGFSISLATWHDLSYHNARRKLHQRLKEEARAAGFDVEAVEASIPTAKTCRVDRYCDHIKKAVEHYPRLYAHYQQERPARWKTYRREQKALDTLCKRVKGNNKAKSKVVAAVGGADWGPPMKGRRAAPTKKFIKHLKRYVTVVRVDEFRTSRMCSKQCAVKEVLLPEDGSAAKKESKRRREERKLAEEEAIQKM
jgi:hypothetical protein